MDIWCRTSSASGFDSRRIDLIPWGCSASFSKGEPRQAFASAFGLNLVLPFLQLLCLFRLLCLRRDLGLGRVFGGGNNAIEQGRAFLLHADDFQRFVLLISPIQQVFSWRAPSQRLLIVPPGLHQKTCRSVRSHQCEAVSRLVCGARPVHGSTSLHQAMRPSKTVAHPLLPSVQ